MRSRRIAKRQTETYMPTICPKCLAETASRGLLLAAVFALSACQTHVPPTPLENHEMPPSIEVAPIDFAVEEIATGFTTPWAIEVLGSDDYLVTDRMGTLYHLTEEGSTIVQGIPESHTLKFGRHYGGLMDVSLHPRFEENRLVYIAFIQEDLAMVVARFRFEADTAHDLEVIFQSTWFSIGSRLAWEGDEHFFVTQGIGGDPTPEYGPQDLTHHGGKIHRLMADGSIPVDNPVFDGFDEPTSIWSYGHRDPQGLFYDKKEGVLYANEHGPMGGDELNIIEKGGNHGWPLFSYGLNYDGTTVGELTEAEAVQVSVMPVKAWGPDFRLAPSSLTRLDASTMPEYEGWFVHGSLFQHRLVAYDLESGRTVLISGKLGRIRDVVQLQTGDLIVLTDSEGLKPGTGRILRLSI